MVFLGEDKAIVTDVLMEQLNADEHQAENQMIINILGWLVSRSDV